MLLKSAKDIALDAILTASDWQRSGDHDHWIIITQRINSLLKTKSFNSEIKQRLIDLRDYIEIIIDMWDKHQRHVELDEWNDIYRSAAYVIVALGDI